MEAKKKLAEQKKQGAREAKRKNGVQGGLKVGQKGDSRKRISGLGRGAEILINLGGEEKIQGTTG